MQQDDIPKEGDVVIWKHNPALIIKAKLGQRREHVPDPRLDHLTYEPERERYLGQFPIDYMPEKFPTLTEAEVKAIEERDIKHPPAIKSMHFIEFSLMLNGAKAKATDSYNNDDENQVKVVIDGLTMDMIANKWTTKSMFESSFKAQTPVNLTKKNTNGLDCYLSSHGFWNCLGQAKNNYSTWVSISQYSKSDSLKANAYERLIQGESHEFVLGGISIRWQTDPKNLNRWQEIDAAIWRLLDAWNVSPLSSNPKISNK